MTHRRRVLGGRTSARKTARLVPILILTLLASTFPTNALAATGVSRQAGVNRFATAQAISANTFSPGVNAVYIVNGLGFADALAAGPAAAHLNGPVLLVNQNSIPSETAAELNRLNPDEIIVAGGTGVVSAAVEASLDAFTTGTVTRQAGANRFATAAAISAANFNSGVNAVYIVNGLGFPDALAAGPAAADLGGPVLLVTQNAIPSDTAAELTRLNPDKIIVAGGTGVVSASVEAALDAYTTGNVTRQAGLNRFATAATISNQTFGAGVNAVYIANGLGFPDALAAGPAAAQLGGPLLLVNQCSIPSETAAELDRLNPDQIIIAGGTGVVCSAVEQQLVQYINCVAAPPDTDGDGINDTNDSFACDPSNATGRTLPFTLSFNGGGGGIEDTGFTGLMRNGTNSTMSLYNPADVSVTGGMFRLQNIGPGDALNATNTLENGFQVNVTTPVSTFTVHGRICGSASYPTEEFASAGVFFGPGNDLGQDNYIKITLKGEVLGPSVHDGREVGGVGAGIATHIDNNIPAASCIELYLHVNTSTLTYSPSYSLNGGTTRLGLGGNPALRTVPASWVNGSQPMAVGLWLSSAGPAPEFTATFDLLEVAPGHL